MRARAVTCLASLGLLLAAGSAPADSQFHGSRVYVASEACSGRTYRPSRITIACGDGGFFATGIRYSHYGGRVASATAELNTHSCVPNCAQSAFHAFPGTIALLDVVRCDGALYYSEIRYSFTDGAPYGEDRTGRANIRPQYDTVRRVAVPVRCSTVLG